MKKRTAAFYLAPVALVCSAGEKAAAQPNVLFIMADDLGWSDTTLYGHTDFYETPNLDRLRQRGMLFTQAYSAYAVCSPSRYAAMTGNWPCRAGWYQASGHVDLVKYEAYMNPSIGKKDKVKHWQSATRTHNDTVTLADAFKAAGYDTAFFGKWHMGREPSDPLHMGFDSDIPHTWLHAPPGGYLAPWRFPDPNIVKLPAEKGENIETRMAAEASKYIRQQAQSGKPFFMCYWNFSVHTPLQGNPDLVKKYEQKAKEQGGDQKQRHPVYGAMVETMDAAVGTLLDTLEKEGLADNTIIVFTSDNGGLAEVSHGGSDPYNGTPVTDNSPLRGSKAMPYEGGFRVPLVVAWPGHIVAGSSSPAIFSGVDFFPTLTALAGVEMPPGSAKDGISQKPVLLGGVLSVRDEVFMHAPVNWPKMTPATVLRKGDWKLIRYYFGNDDNTDRYELFDLAKDMSETTNLASQYPERVQQLAVIMDRYIKETGANLPTLNKEYDAAAAKGKPEAAE